MKLLYCAECEGFHIFKNDNCTHCHANLNYERADIAERMIKDYMRLGLSRLNAMKQIAALMRG
jgi:hypothetical protein